MGNRKASNEGARTKYGPEVLAAIARAAVAGSSDKDIIEIIGCNTRTFYRWRERYPEINEALDSARDKLIDYASIAKHEKRRQLAEAWIDHELETRGKIDEVCDGDGLGSYKKTKTSPINWRLIDRILGTTPTEKFEVNITVAMPEPDDDDDEFDEEEFD